MIDFDAEDLVVYNDQDGGEKFEPNLFYGRTCPFCAKFLFKTSPGYQDCIDCDYGFGISDGSYHFIVGHYHINMILELGCLRIINNFKPGFTDIHSKIPVEYFSNDKERILDKIKFFMVFR